MYSFESIRDRIKSYLENPVSKIEGTFSMDNIGAVSQELARIVAMEVAPIPDNHFLDTAKYEYLDRKALDFNESRIQAQKSTGILIFEGSNGITIPSGTVTGDSQNQLRFETLEDVIIEDNSASVNTRCTTAGKIGNVGSNFIDTLVTSISGVSSVINIDDFIGGVDEETDESLRERIIEKIQKPITSGNKNHYEYWAKQVAGVGSVKVLPCWNGGGTVKVIILSSDNDIPDDTVIENVANYIEENRPIGADVTVTKAQPLNVDIIAEISISSSYNLTNVKADIETNIKEYLSSIDFDDEKVLSYYKIGDIIFDVDGVLDILSYTINGGTVSLQPQSEYFFTLNEVVVYGN